MTEVSISGQYNDALFTIFGPPAMLKIATEEFIPEKVFKYLICFYYNCKKLKVDLNFRMSMISFHYTVQSLWIQSQEILILAIYLPKLKLVYNKKYFS